MELTRNQKYGIAGTAVVVAFASGYYAAPYKIKTETKVVEVEKKKDDKVDKSKEAKHKHKKRIIEKNKDGSEKITETEDDDDTVQHNVSHDKTDDSSTSSDTTKLVEKSRGVLSLSLLIGGDAQGLQMLKGVHYGLHVQRNLIGPVTLGVFGLSTGQGTSIGGSIGLNF